MPQALVNEELAESSAPHDPFWGSFDPSSLLAEEGLFDHVNVIDPELAGPPVGNDVNMFSIIGEGGSTHDAAMDDRPSLGFETNNHSGDQTQLDISSTTRQETTNQGTPSGDEMLRMLHTAQQRLREQRAQHGLHRHTTTSTTGRSVDIGIFFQMIEFAHETIRRSLPKFCNNDGNMTCDITAGLAFAATLNSVVEVYELIVAWDSSSPSPSSYTSGSRPSSSDGWNSSRTRPQSNLNSSDSDISDNSAIRPASEPQQRFQVRIGTFFPSEAVSRRILADVLVTEVHTSSKMIDRLRQHIFQSQSSATASALLSVQPGEGSNSSSSSLASLNDTFSSEMQWTLIQLLNQLQTRIARIEQHTRGARH